LKISFDCDTEAVELAATNQVPNAMMEVYAASKKLAPSELDIPEKSDKANKPQPVEEVLVKTIDLGTAARPPPSGRASTRNRKTRSSTFSRLTETSSRGNQRTCQGCPGN
jgi:hypothetical protein